MGTVCNGTRGCGDGNEARIGGCMCSGWRARLDRYAPAMKRFFDTVDDTVLSGEREASDQEKAIFKKKSGIADLTFELLWKDKTAMFRQRAEVSRRMNDPKRKAQVQKRKEKEKQGASDASEAQKLAWQIYSQMGATSPRRFEDDLRS